MSGQRKKGSKQLSLWISESEKKLIQKEMEELGYDNLSDYLRHKLDMPPLPKGRPPSDCE